MPSRFYTVVQIFHEGCEAYRRGLRSDQNPYTPGLTLTWAGIDHELAHALWRFGWMDEAMTDAASAEAYCAFPAH